MKVYYFTAAWCKPCKAFGPIMADVKESLKEYIDVEKVDIEDNAFLVDEFSIASVPTVLIAEGSHEIARFVGARDEGYVLGFIAPHITIGGLDATGAT